MAEDIQKAALAELARRELERRQSSYREKALKWFPSDKERDHEHAPAFTGLAENVVAGLTGAADSIAAGWRGIGAALVPGGDSGAEAVQRQMQKPLYTPKTESGKMFQSGLDWVGEKVERGADYVGEVSGKPEQALGATAVKTALLAAPMLLGARKGAPRPKTEPAPTINQLKSKASEAYKTADESGVAISKDSFTSFVERVMDRAAKEGIDPKLTPDSMAVLERLMDKSGNNFTLKGLEIERRAMGNAGSAMNPGDRRMASIIRSELDDFVNNLGPDDMFGNKDTSAITALKGARENWSKARKSELMQKVFDDADVQTQANYSVAGYETALRQGFKNLYKRIRDGKERGFTDAEVEAIRKVATGGPMQNAMRTFGKLTPNGAVSGAASAYIASMIGGPMAAALPAAAWASRGLSASKTARNAKLADEMVRRGGPEAKTPVDKKRLLAAALLAQENQ